MTVPSTHSAIGVFPQTAVPLWGGRGIIDDEIFAKMSGYDQEKRANIGSYQATITATERLDDALNWVYYGLGSDCSVYSSTLSRCFRGFVNKVSFSVGGVSIDVGPMLDIINRLTVKYQTVSYNTNPPVGGTAAATAPANNTDSQDRYSILVGELSGGEGDDDEIEALRDNYVQESAWPAVQQALSLGGGSGGMDVKIEIAGYGRLLEKFFPVNTGTGTDDASVKIADVLSQDPNGLFTATYGISENTLQVGVGDDGGKSALSVIKETVSKGDTSNNRWLFYVDDNLTPVYKQAPTTITYSHALSDSARFVHDLGENAVFPWDIKPGYWLRQTDFVAQGYVPTLGVDPSNLFIETVKYSLPWGLQINGGRNTELDQQMAKLGLGGSF